MPPQLMAMTTAGIGEGMASKFYLHITTPAAGPTAKASTDTDNFTTIPTDKNTCLKMTLVAGASQQSVDAVYNTGANSKSMMRMWASEELSAQVLTGSQAGWILALAGYESSAQMNLYPRMFAYIWRSGSGNVKTIIAPTSGGTEISNASETGYLITATGAATDFNILLGDRLVVEWWWDIQNTKSSNYTATGYFDGTTDPVEATAVTSAASYFLSPQTLNFPAAATDWTKNLADTATLGDSPTSLKEFYRTPSDGVSLADSPSKAATLAKADGASLADVISKAPGLIKADSASLADAAAKAIAITKADIGTLADVISKAVGMYSFADGITATDFFDALIILVLQLNDGVTLADSITGKAMGLGKADSITPADDISTQNEFYRTPSDGITLGDGIIKEIGKIAADSASLVDALSKVVELKPADVATLVDAIVKTQAKILADSASLADDIDAQLSGGAGTDWTKNLADTATLTDLISASLRDTIAQVIKLSTKFNKQISLGPVEFTQTIEESTKFNKQIDLESGNLETEAYE